MRDWAVDWGLGGGTGRGDWAVDWGLGGGLAGVFVAEELEWGIGGGEGWGRV